MGEAVPPPPPMKMVIPKFIMGLKSIHRGSMGGWLKMLSKNICEGVHLIVTLPAISLEACKFTKNELLHAYFSRFFRWGDWGRGAPPHAQVVRT